MGVHDNAVNAAYRAIQKHGRAITVLRGSEIPTTAATPWLGSDDEFSAVSPDSEVSTKGVFVDPMSATAFGFTELAYNTLHQRGGEVCIVAAKGLVDLSKHEAIRDGTSLWKIERAHVLKPGDTPILYAFEVVQ